MMILKIWRFQSRIFFYQINTSNTNVSLDVKEKITTTIPGDTETENIIDSIIVVDNGFNFNRNCFPLPVVKNNDDYIIQKNMTFVIE